MDTKIDLRDQPAKPIGQGSMDWVRKLTRTRNYILGLSGNQRIQFIEALGFCDGCGAYLHNKECQCK